MTYKVGDKVWANPYGNINYWYKGRVVSVSERMVLVKFSFGNCLDPKELSVSQVRTRQSWWESA